MTDKVFCITSGKGGVGKSTLTANIATALAMKGYKVVAVDADIGLRNLDLILGLENRIVYDIVHVVEGICPPEKALIKDKRTKNLFLLPAAQTRDKSAVKPEQLLEVVEKLREKYDFIFIDSPAGIEEGFKTAVTPSDSIIVVANPEMASIRDADRVTGICEAMGKPEPKLIIADEPVSALDVSIQSQILNLLLDLRDELNLTMIFISHDLSVVRYIADNIAVMHKGTIVEYGESEHLFNNAKHPYTQQLLAAIPQMV